MSEVKERSDEERVDEMIGEFTRRVIDGESTTDLFGVNEDFVNDVVNRAYQLYSNKNFDKAEVLIKGATVLDQTRAYPHLLLGDILLQRSQFADAVETLEKARHLDEQSPEILAKLGEAQVRLGEYQAAVATLEAALELLNEGSAHKKRTAALLKLAIREPTKARVAEQA